MATLLTIRLANVVSSVRGLQEDLNRETKIDTPVVHSTSPTYVRVCMLREVIESVLKKHHATVNDLPAPSRDAFLWMSYLSDAEAFNRHVRARQTAWKIIAAAKLPVHLRIGCIRSHWNVKRFPTHIDLQTHEALTTASESVWRDFLLSCAKWDLKSAAIERVKSLTFSPAYMEVMRAQLPSALGDITLGRGRFFQLEEVFERVNRRCFSGLIQRPRLVWSRRHTRTVLGTYSFLTDTLTLSRTLDHPDIPDFVVDHVMHHELLHKVLGLKQHRGHTQAHTPEFRARERAFPEYEQAKQFIRQLGALLWEPGDLRRTF